MPDDDNWLTDHFQQIGTRVRAERRRQGLTQDQVWQAARIDRRTLQNVEAGKEAKSGTLLRIAFVLDVPIADLVGGPAEEEGGVAPTGRSRQEP
ncbi:helix-turn-helix domain-containing protein [Streptomyces sp. NPDC057413]|uniref:helix-turn-helix domain-containing protein n=1 Tax=Streptomyces sp. NPDC057413 TaxID=3346124 RepID=UPI0036AC5D2E